MEALRIKELLKEKGLSMKDLADRTGLDQSNLIKSLGNNPKLSTLQEVAKALKVEMHELFSPNLPSGPTGIAIIGGRSYAMMAMPTVVQIPVFGNYKALRQNIDTFVKGSVHDAKTSALCAVVGGYLLVSLVYESTEQRFVLTIYRSEAQAETTFFDLLEFAQWREGKDRGPVYDLDLVCEQMINDIESAVPYEYKTGTTPVERDVESLDQEEEL